MIPYCKYLVRTRLDGPLMDSKCSYEGDCRQLKLPRKIYVGGSIEAVGGNPRPSSLFSYSSKVVITNIIEILEAKKSAYSK